LLKRDTGLTSAIYNCISAAKNLAADRPGTRLLVTDIAGCAEAVGKIWYRTYRRPKLPNRDRFAFLDPFGQDGVAADNRKIVTIMVAFTYIQSFYG